MNSTDIIKELGLDTIGLDFSNPDVKQGALDAIDAILSSRQLANASGGSGGLTGSDETEEIELDPDLLYPSQKQPQTMDDEDVEIDDEDNILDQIKQNNSEDPQTDLNNSDSGESDTSDSDSDSDDDNTNIDQDDLDNDDSSSTDSDDSQNSENNENELETDPTKDNKSNEQNDSEGSEESDNSDESEHNTDNTSDGSTDGSDDLDTDEIAASEEQQSDENDFEDDDFLDQDLKDVFSDKEKEAKKQTRRVKRERTLLAAKKALEDAKNKKVSPNLIKELEQAISALEELTEAILKNIDDLSDDEFNNMINRVFDAIDAVGDKSLTFTSEKERELQAKEIKDDISSSKTQNELSAEDAARIRAENQAIKARDAESNKYKAKNWNSFKGFNDFLNSLYRAIALQVHTNEVNDDSWSAISRRQRGAGVLQPGKKIQDLPDKKIPVIDFYFDQSGSWSDEDIRVGKKAVNKLADMEANGQIKINIYYFANNVYNDAQSARDEGGTAAWNEIVKNVISTQATNVIIMTDSDMEGWWNGPSALSYTVPGYVWYLWRNGDNAPRLPRDLKGRGGVQQFSFNSNDI